MDICKFMVICSLLLSTNIVSTMKKIKLNKVYRDAVIAECLKMNNINGYCNDVKNNV